MANWMTHESFPRRIKRLLTSHDDVTHVPLPVLRRASRRKFEDARRSTSEPNRPLRDFARAEESTISIEIDKTRPFLLSSIYFRQGSRTYLLRDCKKKKKEIKADD